MCEANENIMKWIKCHEKWIIEMTMKMTNGRRKWKW